MNEVTVALTEEHLKTIQELMCLQLEDLRTKQKHSSNHHKYNHRKHVQTAVRIEKLRKVILRAKRVLVAQRHIGINGTKT